MKIFICSLFFLFAFTVTTVAQIDPVLSGMITLYTHKAEKQLKSQEAAMDMQTTGHVWTASELEKTVEIQKAYNDYLDSFRDIICYAAQTYGFYVEIDKLAGNMSAMNRILKQHTQGAFAVALSSRRNSIYRNLIQNSVEIVNDIRKVCLSGIKMTEKERIEIVFSIRPKLQTMNHQLQWLMKAVKYTTFEDVWNELNNRNRHTVDKLTICRDCMRQWKQNNKMN